MLRIFWTHYDHTDTVHNCVNYTPILIPLGVKDTIITPQVLTDQERQLQKEEAIKNQVMTPTTQPYTSPGALNKLLSDVETFGKFVDDLSITILGVSRLDNVWKVTLFNPWMSTIEGN